MRRGCRVLQIYKVEWYDDTRSVIVGRYECWLAGLSRAALLQCSAVRCSAVRCMPVAVAKEDGLLTGLPCFHACSVAKKEEIHLDPDS